VPRASALAASAPRLADQGGRACCGRGPDPLRKQIPVRRAFWTDRALSRQTGLRFCWSLTAADEKCGYSIVASRRWAERIAESRRRCPFAIPVFIPKTGRLSRLVEARTVYNPVHCTNVRLLLTNCAHSLSFQVSNLPASDETARDSPHRKAR
jgi:hypothetical protein